MSFFYVTTKSRSSGWHLEIKLQFLSKWQRIKCGCVNEWRVTSNSICQTTFVWFPWDRITFLWGVSHTKSRLCTSTLFPCSCDCLPADYHIVVFVKTSFPLRLQHKPHTVRPRIDCSQSHHHIYSAQWIKSHRWLFTSYFELELQ